MLFVAPRFFVSGRQRRALITGCLLAAAAYVLLAASDSVPGYVTCFVVISLVQAAMIPATNTLIAANVPRSRRGTAFGWAGSAQAVAFMVGPMSAAAFAAISLDLGFVILGALLAAMAGLLLTLREPETAGPVAPLIE